MAEDLIISTSENKEEKYKTLLPQIEAILDHNAGIITNLANIAAILKYGMNFFWVGFYLVKNKELILGPFQGPPACTRIAYGKGVCGTSFAKKEIIIVPDVEKFPGHIACSSASKSEIVLPALKNEEVALILDVDSDQLNDFDQIDKLFLQKKFLL
ncbi:GAF domain-containing protein [soil metagenome]